LCFFVQIDDSKAVEYGIIGPTTCMGDHKVRLKIFQLASFSYIYKTILRHFLLIMLGTYTYTLPSSYSDDPFFQLL